MTEDMSARKDVPKATGEQVTLIVLVIRLPLVSVLVAVTRIVAAVLVNVGLRVTTPAEDKVTQLGRLTPPNTDHVRVDAEPGM